MGLALILSSTLTVSMADAQPKGKADGRGLPDLGYAESLIAAGRAGDALALLAPFEPDLSGRADFDYILALAYLDTNQPTRAVFALERVLAAQPDHKRAKAELARAHARLGELDAARSLAAPLASDDSVPMEARRSLAGLVRGAAPDALDAPSFWRAKLSLAGGYDSNVSAATSLTSISLPSLAQYGPATLSDSARAKSAWGLDGAGSIDGVHPLTGAIALTGGLGFDRHANLDAGSFDLIAGDAHGGLVATDGPRTLSLGFAAQDAWLGSKRVRQAYGISADYQIPLGDGTTIGPYAQGFRLTYPREPDRSAYRSAFGIAAAKPLTIFGFTPVLVAGLFGGQEQTKASAPFYGHRFIGARMGGELALSPQWAANFALSYEARHYGAQEPLFEIKRKDRELDSKIGISYDMGRGWSAFGDVTWTRAASTIALHDYSRASVMVGLSKVFQ